MKSTSNRTAFVTTRWTRVMEARGNSPEAAAALSELYAAYYAPVLAFLRDNGRGEESARDLAQEFFARFIARHGLERVDPGRGRFRSFLLGAVKHFLADQQDRFLAAKRGGGEVPVSIEANEGTSTTTELQIPDPAAWPSDAVFDRQWALTIVERAINTLAEEFSAAHKTDHFETLKPWLLGELVSTSQAEVARQLGVTEGALKVAIHRLRKRFRELVKAEIAQTVDDPAQIQGELHYLLEVLSS